MTNMDGTKYVMRPGVPVTATPDRVTEIDDYVVAFFPADEWEVGSAASDAAKDADNDADNDTANSSQDVAMQDLLRKLRDKLPAKAPVGQDAAVGNSYDVREFARSIRSNWKIIAPTLTAVSGVAAVTLLTIGARGSVSGVALSLNERWGVWVAGYLMTQASIFVGTRCIPGFQCR